jgi:LPS export ABC transporter protein LptC
LINRFVVLSTLLIAFALAINWLLDRSDQATPDLSQNDPDLYMLNAAISQFDSDGQLQHVLTASRFTHFPLTDLTTMKSPSINLDAKGGESAWVISSEDGRLLPASRYREEIVELWNRVLAASSEPSGDFINIQTESLTVYPEREYLETDQKVYIDSQSGRTTAAGMKAYLDKGRFMFFSTRTDRVRTVLLPNT